MPLLYKIYYGLLIFALYAVQTGEAWSIWKWLGLGTEIAAERQSDRRTYHVKKTPSKYSDDEYETYYVEVPQTDWAKYKEKYNHDEGVKVWEFPSLWDGNIVIPNYYTQQRKKEDYFGPQEDDRTIKGLDNRIGIRLAVPFIGDFQWMRETGPGDFVPELGPGKFQYPGPSQVDAAGGLAIRGQPDSRERLPPPVQADLRPFQGLRNYPWYTRR